VAMIFHGLVEDLTTESLGLAALFPPDSPQRTLLAGVVCVPTTSAADGEAVWAWVAVHYPAGPASGEPRPPS